MEPALNNIATSLHTDWSQVPVENIGEGIARQMIVGEKIMICRLRFAPHTITPAHDHPHEQMTLVERGRVLLPSAASSGLPRRAMFFIFLPVFGTVRQCSKKK